MIANIFNNIIIKTVTLLPISFVKFFAKRYVAGDSSSEALQVVNDLNKQGFSATLDILGEHTQTESESESITNNYINIYNNINDMGLDCNISVKPSHIGLDTDLNTLKHNLDKLIAKANELNNFLRIDMEGSSSTDITIKLFEEYFQTNSNIGTVLQAYLFRTENDIKNLLKKDKFNFRLCKGIYKEPADIAIQNRKDINANYLKLLKIAFKNDIFVGIATHDIELIESIYCMIDDMNISADKFEFQVLYGVPMSGWNEKHLSKGYKVRVYVPFGADWYPYSIRRLKENPSIAKYIIKDLIKR